METNPVQVFNELHQRIHGESPQYSAPITTGPSHAPTVLVTITYRNPCGLEEEITCKAGNQKNARRQCCEEVLSLYDWENC